MVFNKPGNYINDLSIRKEIPKLIFLTIFLSFLFTGAVFIKIIEIDYRNSYTGFFEQKLLIEGPNIQMKGNRDYESYYEFFNQQMPESVHTKNIAFIVWNSQENILWHSNKLMEKYIEKGSIKNNEIFKDMSILDIPEHDFKPFEKMQVMTKNLKSMKVSSEFYKNTVLHFYKIPDIKENIYIQVLREFNGIIPKYIYLYLVLGSFLIAGIITYISTIISGFYLYPLNSMKTSMKHFLETRQLIPVQFYFENEIGDHVREFNSFLSQLSSGGHEKRFDDSDGRNRKVIEYLQQMLLKKSIRKSEFVELVFYPRYPENDFRIFATIEEPDKYTNILFVHFDINNIEANIEKHLVQDRFKDVSLKANNINEISEELFKDFVIHADLGPGFLLIQIREENIQWVRLGPFHLFTIDMESNSSMPLQGGLDYLPTELISAENSELDKKYLLVISDDILGLLNMDPDEFSDQILQSSGKKTDNSKKLLSSILNRIHTLNPDVLKQSPMISLIRLKS